MSGYFRFFLAITVVAFHAGFKPFGFQIGASAVVSFYLLSGFAMTGLFDTHYRDLKAWKNFLLERFFRIYPQYYFWLVITLTFSFGFGWWSDLYPERELSLNIVVNALVLIGYAFGVYIHNLVEWNPIGITTSLANEELFYFIAPLFFVYRKFFDFVAWASLIAFGCSLVGVIENNVYTYYYFPGPLVYIYVGHLIYRKCRKKLLFFCLALTTLMTLVIVTGNLKQGLNFEIFAGVLIGGLAVQNLVSKESRFSRILGDSSYGIFLSHTAILIALKHFKFEENSNLKFGLVLVFLSSIAGYISFTFVEKPTMSFRRKFRIK